MSEDDLAERLRRLDGRYLAEVVRERAQEAANVIEGLVAENERLRAEAAAADDVFLENEQLTDYGLEMLGRAMKAGHEREILRRQMDAVLALCDDSRQVLWPSAHGYPSGWTLDPDAVRAALRQ